MITVPRHAMINFKATSSIVRGCLCSLSHRSKQNISFSACCSDSVSNFQKINSETKTKSSATYSKPRLYQPKHKELRNTTGNITLNKVNYQLDRVLSSNQNDPDTFGTLSDDWKFQQQRDALPDEEDDIVETEFLDNKEGKRRLSINKYAKIMKKFISQKKIGLAIEVLETRMLKEDRVQPDNYIYNLLIGACGQVGYTKKAFQLYNQMKERGLKVTGHTYTGLFNACANGPYPKDSIRRALHLRLLLIEKAVLMNQTIYHSMIKAFGRCGDLETAFMLVDEMIEKKIQVTDVTFNFLLQACITDKTAGFRHALLVWWKMMQRRVKPGLFSFNLLLRCSRDCGIGDEVATNQVIQVLLHSGQDNLKNPALIPPTLNNNKDSQLMSVNCSETAPNLISLKPTMGNVIAVKNITHPEHRLMMMGGCKGVLELMKQFKVKPDIKTFTQLLDQLPPTTLAEQELLAAAREAGVALDVDLCNMLIRKRCLRFDYDSAKSVLKIIQEENLKADMMTFGVLAMACQSLPTAQQLIQDIDNLGFRLNVEILGTLLKNACYVRDCDFVMEIMKTLEEEGLKPNEMFLKHLDNFYRFSSKALNDQTTDNTGKLKLDRFYEYCQYYKSWRRKMSPDPSPHPWSQFQELKPEPEDLELLNTGKTKCTKQL